MRIVLNTSPIIFLSKVNSLVALNKCFSDVFVPQGVVDELHDCPLPHNMQICSLSTRGLAYVQGALGRLHQGELEAIMLAQELSADYVILDDLLARGKAKRLGLHVMGTLGILLLFEKRSILSTHEVWDKITQLIEQHGLYLSANVLNQIKQHLFSTNNNET